MAVALVQEKFGQAFSGSGDFDVVLDSTATASNLLVALVCKSGDTVTTPAELPSGFTEIEYATDIYDSRVGYKIAAGGEQTFTFPTTDTAWKGAFQIAEFSGLDSNSGTVFDADGYWYEDATASTDSIITAGPFTPSAADGVLVAAFVGFDARAWRGGTHTLDPSASWSWIHDMIVGSNQPYLSTAYHINTTTASKTVDFETTDTGGNANFGYIAHFREAATGGFTTTVTGGGYDYTGGTIASTYTENVSTTVTGGAVTYTGGTIASTFTDDVSTAVTGATITYAGGTILSNVGGNVSTTVLGGTVTYAGGTITSSLTENVDTVVTGGAVTYAGGTIGSSLSSGVNTTVTGGVVTYAGGTINSIAGANYTTTVTGGAVTYAGGTIGSFASDRIDTVVTGQAITYTGGTIGSIVAADFTTVITGGAITYAGGTLASTVSGATFEVSPLLADFRSDMADFVSDADDTASTISIGLTTIAVIEGADYEGVNFENYEIASHDAHFYAKQSDLDGASAAIGSLVFMNDINYRVDSIQPNLDTAITLVTLERV